jgi:hypothetical protein
MLDCGAIIVPPAEQKSPGSHPPRIIAIEDTGTFVRTTEIRVRADQFEPGAVFGEQPELT